VWSYSRPLCETQTFLRTHRQLNMLLVELLHLENGLLLRKGKTTQTDRRVIDKEAT
jgi:hypothetical protein